MEKITRKTYKDMLTNNKIMQRSVYTGVFQYCERAIELLIQNDVSPFFVHHNLYNTYSVYDVKSSAYTVRALHSHQTFKQKFDVGDEYYRYNFLDHCYLVELKQSGVLIILAYKG